MTSVRLGAVAVGLAAMLARADEPAANPNAFYGRGTPTFVVGTLGDDRDDREVRAQVDLVRGMVFPAARVVNDVDVDPAAWPANPVLYGGPHVNALAAKVAPALPFSLGRGRLEIGGRTLEGDDVRLIALVPAGGEGASAHPEFLLYAGTGTPGTAEINAIRHGPDPILIADRFGRLDVGAWRAEGGRLSAFFPNPPSPREPWREVVAPIDPERPGDGGTIRVSFLGPASKAGEDRVVETCRAGAARSLARLGLRRPGGFSASIHVYDDAATKARITGDAGDGHAVPAADAIHVLAYDPAPGGPLERLVAHESTHVFARQAWGLAGTPLMGEGLAVWAAGTYAGTPLDAWAPAVARAGPVPAPSALLGRSFRALGERRSYPIAGLFVEAAVGVVGIEAVGRSLYTADAAGWADACRRAGVEPGRLDEAFRDRVGKSHGK